MTRLLAVLATIGVGALIALQPPINSELAKRTSVVAAAFIATAIAALALGAVAVVLGEAGPGGQNPPIPPPFPTGGAIGAGVVVGSPLTPRPPRGRGGGGGAGVGEAR